MSGSGPTLVDMHVKLLDEDVVERAVDRGLDAIVYAPHFTRVPTIRERAARHTTEDLLVVPGREVFAGDWRTRRHVLAVGLEEPVPDFIDLEVALDEFERQGAAVLVPHPGFANVSLTAADVAAYADRLDAIETYNAKLLPRHNRRARDLAREVGLPGFGSSYAHLRGTVGEAWTAFEDDIDSEEALVAALREGAPRRVLHRSGATHRARGLAEFAHLLYENSWGKVDRLLLSGMEPTHPDHIAYEGRFDEASRY